VDRPAQARISDAANGPAPASRREANDVIDVSSVRHATRMLAHHQQRLERALENRRKLVDAIREIMSSGGLDSPEDAERAAEGMLRRGAVA
jgi:hypothetical protein